MIEKALKEMEQQGKRVTNVKYSYYFTFKESSPKEMNYFLSYKSFRGQSMGLCDYALESKHKANAIDTKQCYYALYRTKEEKDKLSLLYEVRMDYIKKVLLEKALTALFVSLIFLFVLFFAINTHAEYKSIILLALFGVTSICYVIYYFYGFFKQHLQIKAKQSGDRTDDNQGTDL